MRLITGLIKRNPKLFEFVKFGIVGGIVLFILYLVYYLLLSVCGHNLSYTVGYMVSIIVNYLLTVYFTFKVKLNTKRTIGFVFSHLVNYLIQIGCLNLFLVLGISEQWAPFPVFIICVPINFLLVRYFIKKDTDEEN